MRFTVSAAAIECSQRCTADGAAEVQCRVVACGDDPRIGPVAVEGHARAVRRDCLAQHIGQVTDRHGVAVGRLDQALIGEAAEAAIDEDASAGNIGVDRAQIDDALRRGVTVNLAAFPVDGDAAADSESA